MMKIEFIARYMSIERRMHSLLPDFKLRDGMHSLLETLHKEQRISNTVFGDMVEVLELRNQLVGKHEHEISVPLPMADKIMSIKTALQI